MPGARAIAERTGALALADVDVQVHAAGVAFVGGVVLAQVDVGRAPVAVAERLGIADAGADRAMHLQTIVVGGGGNGIPLRARAAVVAVVGARCIGLV